MNLDALIFFDETFYESLYSKFKQNLSIQIIGSNPTKEVINICNKNSWKLYINKTDNEILELLKVTDFTIMPFKYTAGIKLKFLFSLAHSIPYLASASMKNKDYIDIETCLFSDNVDEWINHIVKYREISYSYDQKKIILNKVERYSWHNVLVDFLKINNLYIE
jgi:hypothetical protein